LIDTAEQKRAVFQIGFVERFNPAVVALEKVIGRPLFIETHRLHPFFTRGTDVDVVLDLMIHDLDIILHFVKSSVENVDAVGVSILSDKVDIANARVTFQDGCVANITASRVTNKNMQKIRFSVSRVITPSTTENGRSSPFAPGAARTAGWRSASTTLK